MKKYAPFHTITLIYIFSLFYTPTFSQWIDIPFAGNDYEAVVTKGDTIIAGGPAGLYISYDNGANYKDIMNGLTQYPWIRDIVLVGNKIFISIVYDGVFVSENNGETWKSFNTGLNFNNGVHKLYVTNNYLFVGASSSIYRTSLSAPNWEKVLEVNGGVTDITGNEANVFAATSATGVYFSSNSGATWEQKNDGLPTINSFYREIRTIGVNKSNDLYVGVRIFGVYKFNYNENKWELSNNGITDANNMVDTYYYGLQAIGNIVLVGNSGKVYLSTNRGASFSDISDDTFLYTFDLHINENHIYTAGAGIKRKINNNLYILTSNKQQYTSTLIKVFPNPFSDLINVEFPFKEIAVSIFTITGKLLKKEILYANKAFIDTHNLDRGLYILKIEIDGQEIICRKILK